MKGRVKGHRFPQPRKTRNRGGAELWRMQQVLTTDESATHTMVLQHTFFTLTRHGCTVCARDTFGINLRTRKHVREYQTRVCARLFLPLGVLDDKIERGFQVTKKDIQRYSSDHRDCYSNQ